MKPTTRSPSYLFRNLYSYFFRMVVPTDLQRPVGKKEIHRHLKTGYFRKAKNKARFLAGQVQFIFNSLSKGDTVLSKLSDDQIQRLVHKYVKQSIERWDARFTKDWDMDSLPPFDDTKSFHDSLN